MKFDKVYKSPFSTDGITIWAAGNMHALDLEDAVWANGREAAQEIVERVVKLLNGEKAERFENVTWKGTSSDCVIFLGGVAFLEVRGGGHLTGPLGLSAKTAAHIQDEFASWVVFKISK